MPSVTSQWLLGLAIVVVGAFMLFGRTEEAPHSDQAALPIKPVDARTKACMAEMTCMQDFFLKVTLGNEYEPRMSNDPRVNKWRKPIRYRFYGKEGLDQGRLNALDRSAAHIVKIAEAIGADLEQDLQGINAIVILSADLKIDLETTLSPLRDEFMQRYPEYIDRALNLESVSPVCAFSVSGNSAGEIADALILINAELNPATVEVCVYEEFSQMLGLFSDVSDDIDSLYRDQAHRRQLTEFDFLLLRLLYHPMIEPGMTRDQVIDVFPDVYRQTIEAPAARSSF